MRSLQNAKEEQNPKTRTSWYYEKKALLKFQEICSREGVSMNAKLCEFADRYITVHDLGNPQLRIDKYAQGVPKGQTCFFCQGHYPNLKKVEFISGLVALTCPTCLGQKSNARTVKRVLGVIS